MSYKKMINELEKRRLAIGKERDRLCELQDEAYNLLNSLEDADENLQSAIDALSRFA